MVRVLYYTFPDFKGCLNFSFIYCTTTLVQGDACVATISYLPFPYLPTSCSDPSSIFQKCESDYLISLIEFLLDISTLLKYNLNFLQEHLGDSLHELHPDFILIFPLFAGFPPSRPHFCLLGHVKHFPTLGHSCISFFLISFLLTYYTAGSCISLGFDSNVTTPRIIFSK